MSEGKIDKKFNNKLGKISRNVLLRYVGGWQDSDLVYETMENWDSGTKETALDELDELVNEENEMEKTFAELEYALTNISEKDLEDIKYLRDCLEEIKKYAFL